jgi:acetolactate synthase small subunit
MSVRADLDPFLANPVACFSVVAGATPGVMPRVLEVFAKRGLVPCQWYSTVHGRRGEDLHIDFQVAGVEPGLREQIAEGLRQVIDVAVVLTSEKRRALTA